MFKVQILSNGLRTRTVATFSGFLEDSLKRFLEENHLVAGRDCIVEVLPLSFAPSH